MTALRRQSLDQDNPWPGLEPFDETDRDFFHGRSTESADLLSLVRRELLTVLFGRSGLGKTSLLKAGLFPLLRGEDYLPVYVRLDHADQAPPLRNQVLHELQVACEMARVQATLPATDEGLWSFFHRRDAEFWSRRNRPVTPVVVFDPFEEIFTVGQETDVSRERAAAFLAELADLVENRPPNVVRQALEADPTVARHYDFKRAAVRLVLSFREDFLAEMEGLKAPMPSLMYNRYRLLPMDGSQAYAVVTAAGGHLMDNEIARRILRLTWKNEPAPPVDTAEFPRMEIDPALLSVVCSELNHKRQLAKPPLQRITPALLEGADREILTGFYERGVAGLDPRVRGFVEDELITDRGYRDSHDLDDALSLPGITREALDALIQRRLLRVDERQHIRRLELTHDVLTRVVKESRDQRRAREAEAQAALAQQGAWLRQRRNRRNGLIALVGIVLIVGLAGLAGWYARARADYARERAEYARELAEDLVQFMVFDLRDKLAPIGRLDLMASVNAKVAEYYGKIGATNSPASENRRAASYSNQGDTLLALGKLAGARKAYEQSLAISERLAKGDPSNGGWQRDLSVIYRKLGEVDTGQGDLAAARGAYEGSLMISLRLARTDPSISVRQRDLSAAYSKLGDVDMAQGDLDAARKAYKQSLAIRERLVQADLSDRGWQRDLSESYVKLGDVGIAQGDFTAARGAYLQSLAIREQLTKADPSNNEWQRDLSETYVSLGDFGMLVHDLIEARKAYEQSLAISERLATTDPSNSQWQRDLSVAYNNVGDIGMFRHDFAAARTAYLQSLSIRERLANGDPSNAMAARLVGELRQAWRSERCRARSRRGAQGLRAEPGNSRALGQGRSEQQPVAARLVGGLLHAGLHPHSARSVRRGVSVSGERPSYQRTSNKAGPQQCRVESQSR
ncbi:hypothetical protein BZM27_48105 [Paraburkholderia steynii]|uniref:Novel STAND NTPase 1 domain-containing protein n=1 Tax=Paraburkholderia steynii TaxID=1245441 RepID=A0A4R0X0H9_9BURK|nr:hypothetical protein BZM27_48105 [Paraburkholderia steynii]